MAYHPLPYTALLPLDGVRFEIRHANCFVGLDDPEIDEAHIHNSYEIYVNVSGDVSFLVENRLYPIRSGDAVITRPGEMHLCVYQSACIHEHFCLWVEEPEDQSLLSFFDGARFCNLYAPIGETRQQMLDLLYRLDQLSRCDARKLEMTACFLQLLALFDNRPETEAGNPGMMPGELQQILDYINAHFREIQHVGELYDRFFVSPSTMNRLFRKYIHLSPREFLESRKLSCAQRLLTRDLTVTEVCLQCGFADCSHFISIFKKKFGETPYRYKQAAGR